MGMQEFRQQMALVRPEDLTLADRLAMLDLLAACHRECAGSDALVANGATAQLIK